MQYVLTLLSLSLSLVAGSTGERTISLRRAESLANLLRAPALVARQTSTTVPTFTFQISQNVSTCQPFDIRWTFSGFAASDTNAAVSIVVTTLTETTANSGGASSTGPPQTTVPQLPGSLISLTGDADPPATTAPRVLTPGGAPTARVRFARDISPPPLVPRQGQSQQQVTIVEQLTTDTPLSSMNFQVQALNLPPNTTYTLSATIPSAEGVLVFQSPSFFVSLGPNTSCLNAVTTTVTSNLPNASGGVGAVPLGFVSVTSGATVEPTATGSANPEATPTITSTSNKPVLIAAILGGAFFLFVVFVAIYTIRKSRTTRRSGVSLANRRAFNDANRF